MTRMVNTTTTMPIQEQRATLVVMDTNGMKVIMVVVGVVGKVDWLEVTG